MILRSTIDRVFDTAKVEEVIGDFVQLKKAGSNFKGLSPFSEERTPSFMVSPVKQIWKDFSTGKGGTVVSFLMEHEHFTYPEAIRYLAKKYNITVEETIQSDAQKEAASERESMYLVSEFANSHFQKTLYTSSEGKSIALTYFNERGFKDDYIKKFQLGFSSDDWRVLGFGGRILTNDSKSAKYLNSPESEIYHKSKVLYGIFFSKQSIAKENNCFLVEGYTDVIQFHQLGITNVVSSSGTALTIEQIRLINRLTKNITVLFDGDEAGVRASLRGIDLILEQGMNVKICSFPTGEDPDSFAKKSTPNDLRNYLNENSKDFISFKASLLHKENLSDPNKRSELIREIIISISKIDDQIKQEVYVQECSKIMGLSEDVLFASLAQILNNTKSELKKSSLSDSKIFEVLKSEYSKKEVNIQYELEQKIIEILLLYGSKLEDFEDLILKENELGELDLEPVTQKTKVFEKIYLDLQEDEMQFSNSDFKTIYYLIIDYLNQHEKFQIDLFMNNIDPELVPFVTSILMDDERYRLHNWEKNNIYPKPKDLKISQLVSETILSLRCFLIDKKVTEFKKVTQNKSDDNTEILEDVLNYSNLKRLLSRKLNRVL